MASKPVQFNAGDTAAWSESVADDVAEVAYNWLHSNGSDSFGCEAVVASSLADFKLNSDDTAQTLPGIYQCWRSETTAGGDKSTTECGAFRLLPAPDGSGKKTTAQECVAMLQAAIKGQAADGLDTFTIDGQSVARMSMDDLLSALSRFQKQVENEQSPLPGANRTIRYRFPGV